MLPAVPPLKMLVEIVVCGTLNFSSRNPPCCSRSEIDWISEMIRAAYSTALTADGVSEECAALPVTLQR